MRRIFFLTLPAIVGILLCSKVDCQSNQLTDSLKAIFNSNCPDSTKGRLAEDISYEYYNLSIDSSLHYARISGQYAIEIDDKRMLAQSHNTQGICYLGKSSLMNALDHFQTAYELYHQIGDRKGEAKMLNNLGVIYTETQDYHRAKEKYENSYRLNNELGYWEAASNALYNISGSHFLLKNYDESLKYAHELQQYCILHPEATSPDPLFGDIFEQQGKLDSAYFYMERAVASQEEKGDLINWSSGILNLARVVAKQEKYQEADALLEKVYPVIHNNEFMEAQFAYLTQKAEIFAKLGDPGRAYSYQTKALELQDSIDHLNQMNMINDMNTKYETDRMESQIAEQQATIENKQFWMAGILIVLILISAGFFVVIIMLKKNRRLNNLLKLQNLQINHQRQKIISSINYAKRIQQSTLPKENDFKKLFKDSFIYFKPKDIISGDFYAYQKIGNKVYVAAVDCTGHGVPGAFMSLIANAKLNKVVNEMGERDPGRILSKMHREIQDALHQGTGDDQAMDGVEMSLCAIDFDHREIEFSGAGSSVFLYRRGVLFEYKGNINGLGGADYQWAGKQNSNEFETQKITFENDDLLYMFSDGIHDQIGGSARKKLNKSMFREHVMKISQNAFDTAVQQTEKIISDWKSNNQQTDDMLLIGIKL
ncbi:MAG: tetratricopeptide repeat protein [Flavobacteriales bacterium]|nr:tetratricopeptide repeat protein [Flavobacteriales bacterium]